MSHLKTHERTILDAMLKIQETCMNTPDIPAKELINYQQQYVKLQDALHFVKAMDQASSKILTPPSPPNGMHILK